MCKFQTKGNVLLRKLAESGLLKMSIMVEVVTVYEGSVKIQHWKPYFRRLQWWCLYALSELAVNLS